LHCFLNLLKQIHVAELFNDQELIIKELCKQSRKSRKHEAFYILAHATRVYSLRTAHVSDTPYRCNGIM